MNDSNYCDACGEDIGNHSHYHCVYCGEVCSMYGHEKCHDDANPGWRDRRLLDRSPCGAGGCNLSPGHGGAHRGTCGCANGCKAWECPNG